MDTKSGIFRRKSSTTRSRLAPIQSSSCPTSPRQALRTISSDSALRKLDHSPTSTSLCMATAPSSSGIGLQRSASTVSNYRPRSSPSGLYSYTGMIVQSYSNQITSKHSALLFYHPQDLPHHQFKDHASISLPSIGVRPSIWGVRRPNSYSLIALVFPPHHRQSCPGWPKLLWWLAAAVAVVVIPQMQ